MGTITIAEIRQKPKRSIIVTSDGKQYGCWTDKLAKLGLEQGATYNVETESFETDSGNTLFNVISAKRVTIGAAVERFPSPSQPAQSGPAAAGAAFRTPEQMFVSELLTAYIGAGKCANPSELKDTIAKIREAWRLTFGFLEAAE
jgi:hypothetical protein